MPVPLIRETTQNNKEILTEMELRTSQELPEVQVVERPRPPRAAQSVAVPKIVLLDGMQLRGGVQTVDTPAPQVGEKGSSTSSFARNVPDCIAGVTESGKRLEWARPSCSHTRGVARCFFDEDCREVQRAG